MNNTLYKVFVVHTIFLISLFTSASNLPEKLLNEQIKLLSGTQTSLAESLGKKPVYMKFWATWCQPCLKEMPHFQHVQEQYGDAIDVISINIGINDDEVSVSKVIEQFSLSMPTTIDKSGDLAKAFNFRGTPYHLLFDRQMNLVHLGHKATESLDNKLALLSQQGSVNLLSVNQLVDSEVPLELPLNDGRIHAVYFTATWCDWYLVDSRPEASKNCINGQRNINELSQKFPDISWHGVISRLWTSEQDLTKYKQKYNITYPINIDKSNQAFHQYNVKILPTLIVLKHGQVLYQTSQFNDLRVLEYIAELTKSAQ